MATLRRFVWLALALGLLVGDGHAASLGETKAYSDAVKAFQDEIWWLAESSFAKFVEKYPKSEQRPQAVLYEALSRFYQTNFVGTIELLQTNLDRAGALADEYQFWTAESLFQKNDLPAAAEAYRELWRRYLVSARRNEALFDEALARSRLGQLTQVVELLGNSEGEFARAAQAAPTNEFIARGWLLLAEAQLAGTNYAGAEAAVAPLRGRKLGGALDWRAEHLRFQAQLAQGRLPEALAASSNLLALAGGVRENRAELQSESVALQAGVLERLGRRGEAKEVFKLNLPAGVPEERRRQALLRITELALAEGQPGEAASNLVSFLQIASNTPAADVALFSLGEIHLKQYVSTQNTNDLDAAQGSFDRLVTTFTNSAYVGKAELNRGWCFWLRNQMPESAVAFERAVQRLPDSEEALIARFKLGDVWLVQKDFARAVERYRETAEALPRWPRAREALEVALSYQLFRASLAVTNATAAEEAMAHILKLKPRSEVADRSLLLMAQSLAEFGKPELAKGECEKFLALAPASPLRPEVEVVLGRIREQQADWPGAITGYDDWLARFPTNALRPTVEFHRAWANDMAGRVTNAFTQFTNFVAQFPSDPLAPQAQWWVADYYCRPGGASYVEAEKNYKVLFNAWPMNELAFEARMMAGRAAMAGSRYPDAMVHFTNLTSSANCPRDLKVQAMFAYGDALMAQPSAETNKLANYGEAIRVFSTLLHDHGTNPVAVLAWGELGKCYKLFGSAGMSNAVFCFSNLATSAMANIAARSEAQVGLASVFTDQAEREPAAAQTNWLRQALSNLLEIVYESNLRPGETADDFWLKKAGLEAAALLERLQDWKQAEQVYARLQNLLPVLRPMLQKKIDQLREHLSAEKIPPRG